MQKSCTNCGSSFESTDADLAFLKKVSPVIGGRKLTIPPPTLCPDCRAQRRLSWRNERFLYHRKCDLTGRQIISMYHPDSALRVFDQEAWWSDQWDALVYGRDFDFSRPFFEQFAELLTEVPRISLINKDHENSEYCNFALNNKNSYLLFTCFGCEESFYCNRSQMSRSICDCSNVASCELCYEVIDSNNCYNCQYLQSCDNCPDCFLGYNLRGCHNCFACYGLRNAQYCVGNKQFPKEEYETMVANLRQDLAGVRRNFDTQKRKLPRKYMESINTDNCTGNAIINSRNAVHCYEVIGVEDCRYLFNGTEMKDAMDVNNDDRSELVYEAVGSEANYMHCFNDICWFDKHLLYCNLCFHSERCFGCSGLKHGKYCILNQQYSKEEYEELVPRIIDHMRKTGEWGEFFPARFSPFGYNETMANDFYPETKTRVLQYGWRWRDQEDGRNTYLGPDVKVADSIEDARDDISEKILRCEASGKPYKIIPKELKFYRQMGIPPPKKCYEQRLKERMALRNPRRLWKRSCARCGEEVQTTYAPERPEIIYCEKCYLATIH